MKYDIVNIAGSPKGRENEVDHEIHAHGCRDATVGGKSVQFSENSIEDIVETLIIMDGQGYPDEHWEEQMPSLVDFVLSMCCPCALNAYKEANA